MVKNWSNIPIRDVTIKVKHFDPKKEPIEFKYIDVSSVDRESLTVKYSKYILSKQAPSRARQRLKKNDVIIATVRPTLKRIAYINDDYDNAICSTGFCVLRPISKVIDSEFLYYSIQRESFNEGLGSLQKGASYPAVSDKDVKSQIILLPPLSEQKKIAAVLSTIQQAREKTEAVIEAAKQVKQSMMKHLFTYGPVPVSEADQVELKETEIGEIPKDWAIKKLSDIFDFSRKPRSVKTKPDDKVPFIPMELIPENGVEVTWKEKMVREITSGTYVERGDLIIGKITPCFENGKQAILNNLPSSFGYATTEVWAIHPKAGISINSRLIHEFLKQPHIRNELASKMEGATGRQRLPRYVLQDLLIPTPPEKTQQKMVNTIIAIDQKISSETAKKEALDTLFKSMLEQLITGKVRVVDLDIEIPEDATDHQTAE